MPPAYDAASDFEESLVDESEALEANAQSAKVVKPRDGPLHNPACFAWPATMRLTAPGDFGRNAGDMQWTSIFVVVVASVAPERPEASIVVCHACRRWAV